MKDFTTRYGVRRPREIAAKVEAARAAMSPRVAIKAPAPVLALVPAAPVAPSAAEVKAARIAAQQAERAALRADLPFMRSYAASFDDGPTWEEIEALESRLNDLDDYLIFEPDFAAQMALAA
jgi:hypothetical protein